MRLLWEQEVAGSNPATPTNLMKKARKKVRIKDIVDAFYSNVPVEDLMKMMDKMMKQHKSSTLKSKQER